MPTYRVEEEGLIQDRSRVDARQLRLRLWKDDEYHQFFTVPVAGLDFRDFIDGTPESRGFWDSIRRQSTRAIKQWVEEGGQPMPDPTMAIDLRVNPALAAKEARRRAAKGGPDRPGGIIARFEA